MIGVVPAGLPMAAFNPSAGYFVEQKGREEVDVVAGRSLALADAVPLPGR